jgi:hypothetical protein
MLIVQTKTFYGRSKNLVEIQTWIGVCVYVLAATAKKQLRLDDVRLYSVLQMLIVALSKNYLYIKSLLLFNTHKLVKLCMSNGNYLNINWIW